MLNNLRSLALATVGAVVSLGFSSCAYDPYYSSVGGSYSSGYGDGYGYGGSSFSTSVFVGTGDPRWGYDPYTYSYYDYNRRCYYDPYLYGYYPVGYRPPVVYGVPHPHGWRPGRGYIRPPGNVRNVTVVNYRNRESGYRNSNYGWARQVRQGSVSSGRVQGQRPDQSIYDRRNSQNSYSRPNNASRPSNLNPRESSRPESRRENNSTRTPSRYNSPINQPQQPGRPAQFNQANRQQQARQQANRQPQEPPQRGNRQPQAQPAQRGNNRDKGEWNYDNRIRGYR